MSTIAQLTHYRSSDRAALQQAQGIPAERRGPDDQRADRGDGGGAAGDPADDRRGDRWCRVALDPRHKLVVVAPAKRTAENTEALVAAFCGRTGGRLMSLMTRSHAVDPEPATRVILVMALVTYLMLSLDSRLIKAGLRRLLKAAYQSLMGRLQIRRLFLMYCTTHDHPLPNNLSPDRS